ncbi:MAG: N-acetylmuramoyl-L-alanine amidase [Corynebacteriales bacterium]|nr:N-acetylmuramoyl-L-alanine amidase [Mycobacteriales bacterium]
MRYRRSRPSIVVATVAAVVVASPVIAVIGGSAPENATDQRRPTLAAEATTISQVGLNTVPTIVLDLVRSGLAAAGVTLPPIDLSSIPLPDLSKVIPSGVLPPGLLPSDLLPTGAAPSGSSTTAPAPTTDPRTPVSADVPAGAVVKEISRDRPFSMIGLTWDDLKPAANAPQAATAAAEQALAQTTAFIRAQKSDGSWGPWLSADPADGGPRAGGKGSTAGTEPIWVGVTKAVQVAVTRAGVATPAVPGAPENPASADKPEMTVAPGEIAPRAFTVPRSPVAGDPMAPAAGTTTATGPAPVTGPSTPSVLENVVSTLKAALIDPGTPGGSGGALGLPTVLPGQQPPIITRAQWGADESKRCDQPTYDPTLKAAVVHHSAGNNDYTPEQSAEIVRGIYAYHAQTLGWCDIGYNALVDKYGQIFEGAFGGLDRNVQGTHTGGFNQGTVGVAMLGNYNDVAPTPELIRSVGSYLGWRLKLAGLDPKGISALTSIGFDTAKYGAGQTTSLPMISGHRDYDNTECPGTLGYAALPQIREVAAGNLAAAGTTAPTATTHSTSTPTDATPAPTSPTTAPGDTTTLGGVATQVLSATDPGAIAQKWLSMGGATGALGAPTSAELTTPNGLAKYVDFTNGKIYWSPQTGAQVVQGAIAKAWGAAGYEKSALGLPTGSEDSAISGIITQAFQFGSLVFNKSSGVVVQVIKAFIDEFTRSLGNQMNGASAPAPVPSTGPAN